MLSWVGRVGRIALIGAVVTGLLLLGSKLYVRLTVATPLASELEGLAGVERVVIDDREPATVTVHMEPVAHLREVYRAVETVVQDRLDQRTVRVQIVDRRTPELIDAFYALRPYVIEAGARGNHTVMASRFAEEAARLGLEAPTGFTVDDRYLYVQLHKGRDYLYAVEPRPGAAPGVATDGERRWQP